MPVHSLLESPSRLDALDVDAFNKLLIRDDWRHLTKEERLARYRKMCEHIGLDWQEKPILFIIDRDGKLRPYLSAFATQKLEAKHGVSTTIVDRRIEEGYVIRAVRAWLPNGREKVREGAVFIEDKQGQARADAAMWAETKGARRASLALLGIGLPDESEALDYIGGKPVDFDPNTGETAEATLAAIEEKSDESITVRQFRWYKDKRDSMGWTPVEEAALLAKFGAKTIVEVERGDAFTAVIRLIQDPEVLMNIRAELSGEGMTNA